MRSALILCAAAVVLGCEPIDLRLTIDETVTPPQWESTELSAESAGSLFGFSVDISDNYVIVGAPFAPEGGTRRGAAFIYNINDWLNPFKLVPDSPADLKQFGRTVAVSDDYAVVRCSGVDEIQIFERSGSAWSWVTTFPGTGDFGWALDVSGPRVVASDPAGTTVRIYLRTPTWILEQQITEPGGRFGYSVSMDGAYLVVGDDQYDDPNPPNTANIGTARVYQKSATWIEIAQLQPDTKTENGYFGRSVATCGNNLVVSERGTAKAYFYELGGTEWGFLENLSITGVAVGDEFGTPVSISDRIALASAHKTDSGRGAAYLFEQYGGRWLHKQTLRNDKSEAGDEFGISSATRGDYAIVGAWNDTTPLGAFTGSAFVFHRED